MARLLNVVVVLAALTLLGCAGAARMSDHTGVDRGEGALTSVASQGAAAAVVAPRAWARELPAPVSAPASPPALVPDPPAPGPATVVASAPGPIVALGDSITYGYGTGAATSATGPPPVHSYPWYLERDLDLPVVNAGVGGTTAYGLLDPTWAADSTRPASLRLPALLAVHPRLMIVGFGTNEAIRGWPIRQTAHDLDLLLGRISAAHVPLVLVGTHVDCFVMPCWQAARATLRQRYTGDWDAALGWLAAKYDAQLVTNVEDGFTPDELTDWIHPTAAGYALVAQRVAPAVLRALSGERPAPAPSAPPPSPAHAAPPPPSPPSSTSTTAATAARRDRAAGAPEARGEPPRPQSIWDGQWGGRSSMRIPLLELVVAEVARALG